jgi:hypothetical protein
MIDDDYLQYDQLLDRLENGQSSSSNIQIQGTKKASNLHKFFRDEKNLLCDIDNGVESIDPEKIRKSDLIILDYELEKDDPRKSIRLISQLQKNDHMNLVVVYTRTEPSKVWLQLASNLRPSKSLEVIAESSKKDAKQLLEDWNEATVFGSEIPKCWEDWITQEDLLIYVLTSDLLEKAKRSFGEKYKNNGKVFRQLACEHRLKKLYIPEVDNQQHCYELLGNSNGSSKWIQSGNVFVVIHQKSPEDDPEEPVRLWATLTAGLENWNPSYYQLLVSEIQNSLENDGLPFDPIFSSDVEGHAAWLSKILETDDIDRQRELSNQLISQLVDYLKIKLSNKKELLEFQYKSINSLSTQKQNAVEKSFEEFSALHIKLNIADGNFSERMHHALNANLCSSTFTGKYITSGTIVKVETSDSSESKWYLCVSPACDTVPANRKGDLAKRLDPDRLLKFLVLSKIKLDSALENATSGRNVFIRTPNERLAFNVQNDQYAPEVEYALIHEHNNPHINIQKDGVEVSFLQRDSTDGSHLNKTRLIPVSQLRDSYTARYQTVASHHQGRVGVDYFDLKN